MAIRATIEIEGRDAGAKRLVDDVTKRVEKLDRTAAKASRKGATAPGQVDVQAVTASAATLKMLEGRYLALSRAAQEMSAAQDGVSPQLRDMIGQQVEYAKTVGASNDVVKRWSDLHASVTTGAATDAKDATDALTGMSTAGAAAAKGATTAAGAMGSVGTAGAAAAQGTTAAAGAMAGVGPAGANAARGATVAAGAMNRVGAAAAASTAGIDAISRRITLLSGQLKTAGTRTLAITRLQAAEAQLSSTLQFGNVTLAQRIKLEQELARIRTVLAGRAAAETSSTLASSVKGFGGLVSAIAASAAVVSLTRLIKETIDYADALSDLNTRTGISIETLAGLDIAAQKSGRTIDEVAVAVEALSGKLTDIAIGRGRQAEDALRRIGLSVQQLEGRSAEEQLQLVADALDQFKDGADKAALANDLFGSSGARLLPVLKNLARGGMDDFTAQAKDLHLALSPEQVQNLKDYKDALTQLRLAIKGLVSEATANNIRNVTELLTLLSEVPAKLRAVKAGFDRLTKGFSVATPPVAFAPYLDFLDQLLSRLRQIREERERDAAVPIPVIDERRTLEPAGTGSEDEKKALVELRRARLQALADTAKGEVAVALERNLAVERENQDAYDRGLISLEQFQEERRRLLLDSAAKEIALLKTQFEIEERKPLDLEGKTAAERALAIQERDNRLRELRVEITRAQVRAEAEHVELEREGRRLQEAVAAEVIDVERRIQRARGETAQLTQANIDAEVAAYDRLLIALGRTAAAREVERNRLRAALTGEAQVAEVEARVNAVMARQSEVTGRITDQVTTGQLSERQAREQTLAIHERTLQALNEELRAFEAIAQASGNEQAIRGAEVLRGKIAEVSGAIRLVADETLQLQNALLDSMESSLASIITGLGTQINSARDALLVLLQGLQGVFANTLAQILTDRIKEALQGSAVDVAANAADAGGTVVAAGALSAAGSVVDSAATKTASAAVALGASGLVVQNAARQLQVAAAELALVGVTQSLVKSGLGFAAGGYVRGPGGPTSDSITARLSAGEFVVNARQTAKWRELLELINGGGRMRGQIHAVPRFASGGLVQKLDAAEALSQLFVQLGLEPGLVLRELKSSAGQRAVVEVVTQNRGKVARALPRGRS